MTAPLLLGVGGAHIDRRGQVAERFVPHASNPGTMREEVGGGVFNALRSARQRGLDAALISIRGGDAAGAIVARAVEQAGIEDLSVTYLDRTTPSYTALLDESGELIAGLADMMLYELALPSQLRRRKMRDALAAADAVLADANIPADGLRRLAKLGRGRPFFAIAISPAKVVRMQAVLGDLACLFMNRREAAALSGRAATAADGTLVAALRDRGLSAGAITNGGAPLVAFDGSGTFALCPPKLPSIADVTGAGDALAGATIAACMRGAPLAEALREGMAASLLAVITGAAVPELDDRAFRRALASVPAAVPVSV